jgi:HEPN domain-containing protein
MLNGRDADGTEGDPGRKGMSADADEAPDIGPRLFQQLMDLWIKPEVERRQACGTLARPLPLRAAQILFFPDGRSPAVRINDEVTAKASMKLRDSVAKAAGEPVFASEIESLERIELIDPEHADCGHATLVLIGESWHIAFDFRYHKSVAKEHLVTARQFLDAARFSIDRGAWASAVDNLFSAAELCSKALLVAFHDSDFAKRSSHASVHRRLNNWGKLGNVKPEYVTTFNRLSSWRAAARYPKGPFALSEQQARDCLAAIEDMYEFVLKRM